MASAVAGLIASVRAEKRPPWSQAFLADEMLRRGFATSRNQIARLERSEPTLYSYELVAVAGLCLGIELTAVLAAIAEDYLIVQRRMAARLEMMDR